MFWGGSASISLYYGEKLLFARTVFGEFYLYFLYYIFKIKTHLLNNSKNAKEGYEKLLEDQLRNDPTLFVSEGIEALVNVLQHRAAYPQV